MIGKSFWCVSLSQSGHDRQKLKKNYLTHKSECPQNTQKVHEIPGHPCRHINGTASGFLENNATKWILYSLLSSSIMVVVNWGKEFK
jgi:hypothetical protein